MDVVLCVKFREKLQFSCKRQPFQVVQELQKLTARTFIARMHSATGQALQGARMHILPVLTNAETTKEESNMLSNVPLHCIDTMLKRVTILGQRAAHNVV